MTAGRDAARDAIFAAVADEGVDAAVLREAVRRRLEPSGSMALLDATGEVTATARAWAARHVRVTVPGTSSWPTRLADLEGAPTLLAQQGGRLPRGPSVAIVGQRRATSYGREIASWLSDSLARAGVTIVSGGAVGIDAAAHRAACDAGGRTVVVLGCGHGVDYPRVHAGPGGLFEDVRTGGGVLVSEYLPDEGPRPHRVLARNRLVAALADVVVVVEGGVRSGALNTASHGADQGVPVLAVPGDVRAAGSAATNRLLAEGAAPCRDPQDVLDLLDLVAPAASSPGTQADDRDAAPACLPGEVHDVLRAAFPRPVTLDELAARSGVATGSLLAIVTRARIAGVLTTESSGVRLRVGPPATP